MTPNAAFRCRFSKWPRRDDVAGRRRASAPAPPPSRPEPTKQSPQPVSDPTVRRGVEAFLGRAADDVDSTTMVMLGAHLGPATRLSALSRSTSAEQLRAWFDSTWRSSPRREDARAAVRAAIVFWEEQGWLVPAVAAELRAARCG